MNDRISDAIARWLSHPTGITQAILITVGFYASHFVFGWSTTAIIFWYLAYCTFISFGTQFTLAYQNKKTEKNTLRLMRLLVSLSEELVKGQEEQDQDLDANQVYLERLVTLADRALKIRQLRESLLRREEHMHSVHGLVKALIAGLEGDAELPRETRRHIYAQIESEFMNWDHDRSQAEGLLLDMGKEITEETQVVQETNGHS